MIASSDHNSTQGGDTMHGHIDKLIGEFEKGRLSRRELLKHLGAIIAATSGVGGVTAAQVTEIPASTFQAVGLNHIALSVTDVPRSRDFYIKHLGMKVSRDSASSCFLNFDNGFLALFRAEEPGMDHYCYSIKKYDVSQAEQKLNEQGLDPRRVNNRIYFDDPDGLEVQLASADLQS